MILRLLPFVKLWLRGWGARCPRLFVCFILLCCYDILSFLRCFVLVLLPLRSPALPSALSLPMIYVCLARSHGSGSSSGSVLGSLSVFAVFAPLKFARRSQGVFAAREAGRLGLGAGQARALSGWTLCNGGLPARRPRVSVGSPGRPGVSLFHIIMLVAVLFFLIPPKVGEVEGV